jgi:hypothetical protein
MASKRRHRREAENQLAAKNNGAQRRVAPAISTARNSVSKSSINIGVISVMKSVASA